MLHRTRPPLKLISRDKEAGSRKHRPTSKLSSRRKKDMKTIMEAFNKMPPKKSKTDTTNLRD